MRRKIEYQGRNIDILNVPYISQRNTEYLCLIHSIQMVLFYLKERRNPVNLKDSISVSKYELMRILNADPSLGIERTRVQRLNEIIPELRFKLKQTNYEEIKICLEKNYPVIVIYNPMIIDYHTLGPSHAGVVVGLTEEYVILNNPWKGENILISKQSFSQSWEVEENHAVFIYPNPQRKLLDYAGKVDNPAS